MDSVIEPEIAHTFFFADLAGFTALTEAMGDTDPTDLAHDFCRAVAELAVGHGATRPPDGELAAARNAWRAGMTPIAAVSPLAVISTMSQTVLTTRAGPTAASHPRAATSTTATLMSGIALNLAGLGAAAA